MNKNELITLIANCENFINKDYVNTLTNNDKVKTSEIINEFTKQLNVWKDELNTIKKREYEETVKKFTNACDKKYYVTLWEEYPIFEPAEGGYYYAGRQIVKTLSFNSRKKAIKFYTKHLTEIFDYENDVKYLTNRGNGNYNKYDNVIFETIYNSHYIGENYGFSITHGRFTAKGKQTYC